MTDVRELTTMLHTLSCHCDKLPISPIQCGPSRFIHVQALAQVGKGSRKFQDWNAGESGER